jgi:transcriptional regulator with XRE-family HTH domain
MATVGSQPQIGQLLREWRQRRRRTQLELALDAGISTRHLSFVETGRSHPGAEIVLRIADQLEIPFRERNHLLLAAGHAPAFPERSLIDPELSGFRDALDLVLRRHEPYPAVVVDRQWNVLAANAPIAILTAVVDPELLTPPVNAMRVGLHPGGLAPWIVNLAEVHAYFVARLERQVAVTADPRLAELLGEVAGYPVPSREDSRSTMDPGSEGPARLLRMRTPFGHELSFLGMFATFDTPFEVTTSELAIEFMFPADAATAEAWKDLIARENT